MPNQKGFSQSSQKHLFPRNISFVTWVRHCFPKAVQRPIIKLLCRTARLWRLNSGDWHWLEQKSLSLRILNRNLWRNSEPSFNYYIMLFLSGVISTLGLLAGSTAAIIGAMIVAPLMGPIIGVAFAISLNNQRLLKRSGLSVITGILLTIATAYCMCQLVGINTLSSEILERTQPTLIDLVIGLAAGTAGAFATTRREVANTLPGVAIAVALVPPLSVIGIGLSFQSLPVISGATILFLTNLAGIVLSGGLVFVWQDYGSIRKAKRGLTASILIILALGIPLGISMKELVIEERARTLVGKLIKHETSTFQHTDIRYLKVQSTGEGIHIDLEIAGDITTISSEQVTQVHLLIEDRLERPVDMNVNIIPVQSFTINHKNNVSNR